MKYNNQIKMLTLIFSIAVTNVAAKETHSFTAPLADQNLLTDITKVSSSKVVAVGDNGHILTSSNLIDWTQSSVPTDVLLTAVYFVDQNTGWAVGHDATILNTTDGGVTWTIQQQQPELDKPLLDVYFTDKSNGVAIGAYGMFYVTSNGGSTWENKFLDSLLIEDDRLYLEELKAEDIEAYNDEKSSILPHFNRIYADGTTLYMVGEAGFIAKSKDFGSTWNKLDEIYHGSFYDIKRSPASTLIVAGLRGNIFRSTDHGVNWSHVKIKSTSSINSIQFDRDGRIILLGNGGALLVSEDDGASFRLVEQKDRKSLLNSVYVKDNLILVSEVGIKKLNSKAL